jgi:hypothetical protein
MNPLACPACGGRVEATSRTDSWWRFRQDGAGHVVPQRYADCIFELRVACHNNCDDLRLDALTDRLTQLLDAEVA